MKHVLLACALLVSGPGLAAQETPEGGKSLLDLKPDDHLVEIGCGWGGFALHAASRYGCRD